MDELCERGWPNELMGSSSFVKPKMPTNDLIIFGRLESYKGVVRLCGSVASLLAML